MADFWTGNLNKDPKKEYLFKATLGGLSNLSWDVKSFTKPKITFGAGGSSLDNQVFFGDNFIFKDRPSIEFGDVTITFIDIPEEGITNKIVDILSKSGYTDGYYNPYLVYEAIGDGSIKLEQFINGQSGEGSNLVVSDTWTFYGTQFTEIDFGKNDYSSENFSNVSLSFSYMGLRYNDYQFGQQVGAKVNQRFKEINGKS